MPIGIAGAVSLGAAAIGGISSIVASGKAKSADQQAAQVSQQQNTQTRADLLPYNTAGQSVLPDLTSLAQSGPNGPLGVNYLQMADQNQPGQMNQAQLEATPGYQFTRQQGLQAVQSSAAARGLGVSGAAMKGAAAYATGLADSTYKDQFNIQQQKFSDILGLNTTQQGNITNQFGRLQGTASLGENAGAQTGTIGAALTGQQVNALAQGGLASAAGASGVGNAAVGGANNFLGNQLLTQLVARNGQTGGLGAPTSNVDNTSSFVDQ